MLTIEQEKMLRQIVKGIAAQFGSNCEVLVHDLRDHTGQHTVTMIENGHVSGRKIGDGASEVVLAQLAEPNGQTADHLCYHTRTEDGKLLKSSSIFLRGDGGEVDAILSINYDVSPFLMASRIIQDFAAPMEKDKAELPVIPKDVNVLLDVLLEEALSAVGKPVSMMEKDDKIQVVKYLHQRGHSWSPAQVIR